MASLGKRSKPCNDTGYSVQAQRPLGQQRIEARHTEAQQLNHHLQQWQHNVLDIPEVQLPEAKNDSLAKANTGNSVQAQRPIGQQRIEVRLMEAQQLNHHLEQWQHNVLDIPEVQLLEAKNDSLVKANSELRDQLERVESELKVALAQIADMTNEHSTLYENLEKAKLKVMTSTSEFIATINAMRQDRTTVIGKLEEDLAALRKKFNRKTGRMGNKIGKLRKLIRESQFSFADDVTV